MLRALIRAHLLLKALSMLSFLGKVWTYFGKNDERNRKTYPIVIDRHYKMNHEKRGLAIIFNHESFSEELSKGERTGTNEDCNSLKKTFTRLGFKVIDFHNPDKKVIFNYLKKVSKMNHSNHDCLVVVVLTHGELGLLYAHDDFYKTEDIMKFFIPEKCPSLEHKPKLFFFQACQGSKLDGGITLHERTVTDGEPFYNFNISTHPDFLIVLSSMPGFYSWRNEARGSWFIQALCNELDKRGTQHSILTILTLVNQRVAIDYESNTPDVPSFHKKKQVPCINSFLTRLLQFPEVRD